MRESSIIMNIMINSGGFSIAMFAYRRIHVEINSL